MPRTKYAISVNENEREDCNLVISKCVKKLKQHRYGNNTVISFVHEATCEDVDHLYKTVQDWFAVHEK